MLITCSANNLISSSTKHLCVRRYGEGYVSVCVVCVYVHLAVCVHMCVGLHVRVHACVCMHVCVCVWSGALGVEKHVLHAGRNWGSKRE